MDKSKKGKTIDEQIFELITKKDITFKKDYELIKRLKTNEIDRKELKLLIFNDLIDNFKLNHYKQKCASFKISIKTFLRGIPDFNQFKNKDNEMYFSLADFEKTYYNFQNNVIREQNLYKENIEKCEKILEKFNYYSYDEIVNVFLVLKAIFTLQRELDQYLIDFDNYIEDYANTYDYHIFSPQKFSTKELKKYFDSFNLDIMKDKKKVKSPRY